MPLTLYLTYCAVALVSVFTPGPAVMLAIHNGAHHGWKRALFSSFGNISGLFCLASVSMLGLGALMQTSALVFSIMKWLGAGYLIWLGIKQWRNAGQASARPQRSHEARPGHALYREGLLLALTNPKAILFLTALFPQFIQPELNLLSQFLLLTLTFMAFSFGALMSYASLASVAQTRFVGLLRSRSFGRFSGASFILLGLALLRLRRA
ncbi:LysE family translocator [Chitinimonas sp.]|uniref:LysE family translocator n=1 Tax=Chitinimonas sp. TaxID=1934313 RepID=UPI002F9312A3